MAVSVRNRKTKETQQGFKICLRGKDNSPTAVALLAGQCEMAFLSLLNGENTVEFGQLESANSPLKPLSHIHGVPSNPMNMSMTCANDPLLLFHTVLRQKSD